MRLAFATTIALAALGCNPSPAPSSTAGAASASASASASAPPAPAPLSGRMRLALQPVAGEARVDRQITQAQEVARKLGGKLDAWITLGRLWIQKARETADPGFYLNAGACAEEALTLDAQSPLALGLQSQVALNDHRFADAHDIAQRILARSPEDLVALGVKSDALLEMGRFEEAASSAQRMMDLKPSLATFTRASYFRWLQGDFAGAKTAAWKAASSGRSSADPEPYAWALSQAAQLFWHVGDYEGALAGHDKALEGFADYAPALAGRGRALLSLGKHREAAAALERSLQRSPLVETAWLLGDALTAAGDAEGASKAYERAVTQGRLHDPRTLALFFATKKRDIDEAVRLARAELEKRGDIYTEDALGWALFRAGKLDEARPHLERASRLGTRDASLMFHLGALKAAQGDKAGKALVQEALKLNPKFDLSGAEEAQQIVKVNKK